MDFHAGPARIGENGIDALAFEAGHENFTARHRWATLGSPGWPFGFSLSCLAHIYVFCGGDRPQAHKKTHDRFPAVGSCRNSIHSRQAPTASPTTTKTSRTTCRTFSNMGAI